MIGPSILTAHDSTIRANTEIRAEFGSGGPFFVRVYTAGVVTHQEACNSDTRARERFERVVEEHYAANPLAGVADMERESKLDAERVTLEFASKSTRVLNVDLDGPLFGGKRQGSLF